jgi:glycosyltransferase involved in cell wall biosynthesis
MKSVHITNYYHKDSGGISTSYNNLLAAAERHRRYVRLIVPGETEEIEEVNEFAKIYYVPAKYSPIFDKRYRIMMPWQYMVSDSIIRKILLEEKPDLIEVTDKYTLSLLGVMIRTNSFKKLGRPILVHFSCERMDDNVGSFLIGGRIGKWIARRVIGNYTLPNFDYHIANSSYTAEEFYESLSEEKNPSRSKAFLNWCWRYFRAPRIEPAERIFVCPRGVNAQLFTPDRRSDEVKQEMRASCKASADSILLLYAGRISPEKNIGLLVELMKILSQDPRHDYRLLVAGAGPQGDWLTSQADKLAPDKITLLGHLDKEKLADYYANADIFVHPNPKEPFGIAPLEAMASGVPTVAPDAGGILSYATNENAWLVQPDGKSFAAAVREIIEDPVTSSRKVENALATARENTRDAATDRLFATYDEIYEHFQKNRDRFIDSAAAKEYDFVKEILHDN